jgi:peroxiredoxin
MNAISPSTTLDDLQRINWAEANLPIDWRSALGEHGLLIVIMHGTWCHACLDQIAWLQRKHAWLNEQGVGVLAVAMDNSWQVEAFTRTLAAPLPFSLIADEGAALGRALGLYDEVRRFTRSATLVIDHEGQVRFAQIDDHSPLEQTLLTQVIEQMPWR